ncbi:MAG: ribonuclease HII, partial [Lachnoanaerobaculum saburreum]
MRKISEEKLALERQRLEGMKEFENKYSDFEFIAGIDEAGRGPLAGPVVAAAVILPKDIFLPFLNDSKKVTEKRRDVLFDRIKQEALAYGIGIASNVLIDEINILQATYEAMREAINKLK